MVKEIASFTHTFRDLPQETTLRETLLWGCGLLAVAGQTLTSGDTDGRLARTCRLRYDVGHVRTLAPLKPSPAD